MLGTIIADMLGPRVSQRQIARCQLSVIGQCFHYDMARPIISRLAAIDYANADLIDEPAGRLSQRLVDVGDRIIAGQLLAVLDDTEQQLQLKRAARSQRKAAEPGSYRNPDGTLKPGIPADAVIGDAP